MNLEHLIIAESTLWQQLVHLLTTPSLQLFLLLGSVVLAISVALLTMTRLGHARPITKCVVLSVVAHILLLGYAYGTRLIFHVPVAQTDPPIQIRIADSVDDTSNDNPAVNVEQAAVEIEQVPELEAISNNEPQMTSFPLARPEHDTTFEIERTVDMVTEGETATEEAIDIALLDQQSPQFNVQPPQLEFKKSRAQNDPAPVPQQIEFQRHGEADDTMFHQPEIEPIKNELASVRPEAFEPERDATAFLPATDSQANLADNENQLRSTNPIQQDELLDARPQPQTNQPPVNDIVPGMPLNPNNAPRRLTDGLQIPQSYQLRMLRARFATKRGGTAESEAAVERALKWLASQQKDDGRWCPKETSAGIEEKVFGHDRGGCGVNAETGITSLATLAFLGAGYTHLEGEYQSNVQNALEFLVRQQANNGDLSGNAKLFARMYCHSMTLLALCEAYAITGDKRLHAPVKAGVAYSVEAQNKNGGGWRYQPGDSGDMSQFGWQVMALHAAETAGVEIQAATKVRMRKFLKSCQTGRFGGLASYRPRQGPSTAMTAEALVCRSFLGIETDQQELAEATQRIVQEPPNLERINLYYWYYATLALQRHGGEEWQNWNHNIQRVLLSQQTKQGSWSPDGLWAGYGGRVYSTALATLSLEVYYRYHDDESRLIQVSEIEGSGNLDRIP